MTNQPGHSGILNIAEMMNLRMQLKLLKCLPIFCQSAFINCARKYAINFQFMRNMATALSRLQ